MPHANPSQPIAGNDRRAHERTPISLHGSYRIDPSDVEKAVLVTDISPGGARILAAEIPESDAKISMKISGLGALEGDVVRVGAMEFSVRFTSCSAERERMAASIAWRANKSRLGLAARRGAERELCEGCDPVEFSDGEKRDAEIVDLSLSGAAFRCSRTVATGERVRIGALTGSVVRQIEGGFAVAFDPPAG
tara:strand:- start:3976 stop:4554 length:579 start_codon:yes stop_codon:yes gene_type:complete